MAGSTQLDVSKMFDCVKRRKLALAAERSTLYADTEREGAVFRAEDGASDPVFGRVSFKAFNPAFPHIA